MSPRRWSAPLVLAGLTLLPMAARSEPRVTTEQQTVLSRNPALHSVAPKVVVTDDGTVHVVWQEGQPGVDTSEPVILHRFRRPGGEWSEPQEVYWDGVQPAIASRGGTVGVAFVRNPFDRFDTTEVLYKIWDSASQSWPDIPRAVQGELGVAGSQPDLAFDPAGYIWLAWVNSRETEQRPYYARILLATNEVDGGGPIDEREQGGQGPALAIDPEDAVHVVWSTSYPSGEADLSRWEWPVGGRYWVNRESALYDQVREARSPDITATTSVLCVAWHEGNLTIPNEVILSCDRASGNIWFGNVSQSPATRSLLPSLAAEEERGAMLLWFERESAGRLLFGQVLPPSASSNAEVTAVTTGMPSLSFHDGFAYATWVGATDQGGSEVLYARWRVDVPSPTATPTASPTNTWPPTVTATPSATRTAGTRTPTSRTPVATVTPSPTGGTTEPPPIRSIYTPFVSNPRR